MNLSKHILYSMYGLTLIAFVFETTNSDLWVQNLLFNISNQTWLIDKYEEPYRIIFYLFPKYSIILLALSLIGFYVVACRRKYAQHFQKRLLVVIFSLMLVPLVIGGIKATTNGACPAQLELYGGDVPYVKAFELMPESFESTKKYKCFPAGHASGGFALMSLLFLFYRPKYQHIAIAFAVLLGWTMGIYKMVIGDHFLSHTLTTMALSWLIICLVAAIMFRTLHFPHTKLKGKNLQQEAINEC